MISKAAAVFLGLAFFFVSFASYGLEPQHSDRYLLVGKPVNIKLIRLSENVEAAVSPAYYKAKIKNLEVIYGGEKKFPKTMTLEIRATNSYAFLQYDRVALLVDAKDPKKVEVIFWQEVSSIACLPKALISPEYSRHYFDDKWGEDQFGCMFVRGRVQPSEPEKRP